MSKPSIVDGSESPLEAAELLVDRLTRDGLVPLSRALRDGGLGSVSIWTGMRLCLSGAVDALKINGRWMSSAGAVRRFLEARAMEAGAKTKCRRSRRRLSNPASGRYLDSVGLGREGSKG